MVGAAAAAVFQLLTVPAFAGYELPAGERITNLPAIPRNMPQKEGYEAYDPVIGRNFDIKNFWMRADLRVRPEMRNNTCFGGAILAGGACNTFGGANARGVAPNQNNNGNKGNDFFVQQWIRLGIGYDLSPDVNFYMEIIDSATWGGNGNALNAGNGGDPLNHNCSSTAQGACRLGVRAAYVLVRNLAGVQGLSMKAGRQYVIFGNHSLFGHFDWANTGYSHDGVMFAYQTKTFDSYLGWFRNSETDIPQAAPVGSGGPNIAGTGGRDANRDADMIIFYNQYKGLPGFMVEPYFVYYKNNLGAADNIAQGLGTAKHSNQTRYMVGGRVEMRKGGWDFSSETAWQFGQMGQAGACSGEQKCLSINAWATRNWVGYTAYDFKWKPRLAFNFDYASGDGRNNTCGPTPGSCSTANTFENFFPTNHIHMGYMDIQAWKNMLSPSVNFQARPSERDHIEIWYTNLNLASSKDCWYRGAQGCYVFSNANNTKTHVGDEIDFTWTRMFADGKVAFQATYGTLFTGGYLTSTLNQQVNQHWAYISLWMNF
jgi:hypothetical protein